MSLQFSDLEVELTSTPHPKPDPAALAFGKEFSDHMLEVDWTEGEGWGRPRITPVKHFSIHPAAKVLHYSLEVSTRVSTERDG